MAARPRRAVSAPPRTLCDHPGALCKAQAARRPGNRPLWAGSRRHAPCIRPFPTGGRPARGRGLQLRGRYMSLRLCGAQPLRQSSLNGPTNGGSSRNGCSKGGSSRQRRCGGGHTAQRDCSRHRPSRRWRRNGRRHSRPHRTGLCPASPRPPRRWRLAPQIPPRR